MSDEASQEAGRKGPAREAEEIDAIALAVVAHQETVASHDMAIKGGGKRRVDRLQDPGPEAAQGAAVDLAISCVRSDAGFSIDAALAPACA